MGVRVRVVKDRLPKYQQTLEALSRRSVRVGILGSKAEERHKDEAGEPTPITVAELAVIHEFGTATIPARSFIRVPVDSIRPLIREQLVKYAHRSVEGGAAPEKAMEFVGAWVASLLANGIRKGLPVAPLAEATKRRRRGKVAIPLFDTGQLASSISYEVVER